LKNNQKTIFAAKYDAFFLFPTEFSALKTKELKSPDIKNLRVLIPIEFVQSVNLIPTGLNKSYHVCEKRVLSQAVYKSYENISI